MATQVSDSELDVQEQIARIRRLIAESDQRQDERIKIAAETAKLTQEQRFAPWQLTIAGMGAGAALFAVALAYAQYIIG